MSTDYSEDILVEQQAIALFSELGYDTANCKIPIISPGRDGGD